jgi:hypothetical protein
LVRTENRKFFISHSSRMSVPAWFTNNTPPFVLVLQVGMHVSSLKIPGGHVTYSSVTSALGGGTDGVGHNPAAVSRSLRTCFSSWRSHVCQNGSKIAAHPSLQVRSKPPVQSSDGSSQHSRVIVDRASLPPLVVGSQSPSARKRRWPPVECSADASRLQICTASPSSMPSSAGP